MVEEIVLPEALRDVDLGDDVLEIGPGPGFTTDVLRARAGRLTAVEIDDGLAADLARRLEGTNVEVIHADATSLDLPDDRFTAVTSFNMLHHVPTDEAQDRIFSELARVLSVDGDHVAADGDTRIEVDDFHEGDTYHPIAAADVPGRLHAAGFETVDVRPYDLGWVCVARLA
jgi:ubiquinone/menaquinone biosynthesis C-methylase UbiE